MGSTGFFKVLRGSSRFDGFSRFHQLRRVLRVRRSTTGSRRTRENLAEPCRTWPNPEEPANPSPESRIPALSAVGGCGCSTAADRTPAAPAASSSRNSDHSSSAAKSSSGGSSVCDGVDADAHLQLGLGPALHRPERRRHVGVVAADGGADVAIAGHEVVGRIEADPAEPRHQRLDPGVRRAVGRTIVVLVAVIQVAADVAARDAAARARSRS